MKTLKKVTANATRSEEWWAIEVPEIPGLFTQVRRLDQVEAQVKDAARMLDYSVESVAVEAHLSAEDESMLDKLFEARVNAAQAQEAASSLLRESVSVLHNQGMTMRDVAALLGITPQRVSVLARS